MSYLPSGLVSNRRKMAISAQRVLPELAGAPIRMFSLVLYKLLNVWVWMGLNWVTVSLYRAP